MYIETQFFNLRERKLSYICFDSYIGSFKHSYYPAQIFYQLFRRISIFVNLKFIIQIFITMKDSWKNSNDKISFVLTAVVIILDCNLRIGCLMISWSTTQSFIHSLVSLIKLSFKETHPFNLNSIVRSLFCKYWYN